MAASIESHSATKDAQLVITVKDTGQILGYLVVDTFVDGRSHGGIRMRADVSEGEIRLLARTMSRKYKLLDLPFGGAKAGVIGDPESSETERQECLTRFAEVIHPLLEKEIFVPAGDMGTDLADIRQMLENVGIRKERHRLPEVSSGEYTARSVYTGIKKLCEWQELSLEGARAAIEGFGEVGKHLAILLERAGAVIVGISTSHGGLIDQGGLDIQSLQRLDREYGSRCVEHYKAGSRIEPEKLHSIEADIFAPCATIHTLHEDNVASLRASVVCPGANNPWPEGLESEFERRKIAYLPDFAANAGGVLGTSLAYLKFEPAEIVNFIQQEIGMLQSSILNRARRESIPIQRAAELLLEARKAEGSRDRNRFYRGFTSLGLYLHRRGLVPRFIAKRLGEQYLHSRIRLASF